MYNVLNTLSEFTFQKTLLHTLFCLFLKPVKAFSVFLKLRVDATLLNILNIGKDRFSNEMHKRFVLHLVFLGKMILVPL